MMGSAVNEVSAAAVEASNYEKVARAAVETSSSRYYSHALLNREGRRCRTLDTMRNRSAATMASHTRLGNQQLLITDRHVALCQQPDAVQHRRVAPVNQSATAHQSWPSGQAVDPAMPCWAPP